MIRPRYLRQAAVCAVVALTMAAPAVAADKILRVGIGFLSGNGKNPYQGLSLPGTVPHHAVYDTLTTQDAKGQVAPALAMSWKAESPSVWLFTLRKDVVYSNGEPFTAEALVVSQAYMATPKGRSETIGSTLYQVAKVEAVDALTARVILSEPDPMFPIHAMTWRIPAPKAWAARNPDEKEPAGIGTGPFVVQSWVDGKVVMKANRTSWRAPKVDGLELIGIPDEVARVQAFTSGAINFAMSLSTDNRAPIEEVGGTFVPRSTGTVHYVAVNTLNRTTPLSDKRVRLALNLAVDRAGLVREILGRNVAPASQLSPMGFFGYDPDLKPYPYDPARAKALLAEAGYGKGLKLTVSVSAGVRPSDTLYFQQIAAELEKVGVSLELLQRTPMKQMQDMFAGKLDVDMLTMFTRGSDPITDYRLRTCAGLTQNRAGFHCDPDVVAATKAALAEMDITKREAAYRRIADIEHESLPGIVLWEGLEFDAVAKGVTGYAPTPEALNFDTIAIAR